MMSDSTPLKGERDGDFQSPTVESTDENQPKDSTADSDKDVLGGDFDDDIDGPTSSVNNIIPMDKLKNGWFVLSSYMQVSSGRYLCNIKLLSSRMFPQNRFHSCHLSNSSSEYQKTNIRNDRACMGEISGSSTAILGKNEGGDHTIR